MHCSFTQKGHTLILLGHLLHLPISIISLWCDKNSLAGSFLLQRRRGTSSGAFEAVGRHRSHAVRGLDKLFFAAASFFSAATFSAAAARSAAVAAASAAASCSALSLLSSASSSRRLAISARRFACSKLPGYTRSMGARKRVESAYMYVYTCLSIANMLICMVNASSVWS